MIKNHGIRYRKKKSLLLHEDSTVSRTKQITHTGQTNMRFFFFGLEAGNVEAEGNRCAPGVNGQICNYHTGSL